MNKLRYALVSVFGSHLSVPPVWPMIARSLLVRGELSHSKTGVSGHGSTRSRPGKESDGLLHLYPGGASYHTRNGWGAQRQPPRIRSARSCGESMAAMAGTYRVDGDKLITKGRSFFYAYMGRVLERVTLFRIDGNRLQTMPRGVGRTHRSTPNGEDCGRLFTLERVN